MKMLPIVVLLILSCSVTKIPAQELQKDYVLFLGEDGKSRSDKVPILLQEEKVRIDTLYEFDNKFATKKIKYFEVVDANYSMFKPGVTKRITGVSLLQEENFIVLKNDIIDKNVTATDNGQAKRRLVIDISKGVIIKRKTGKISPITIPIRVYASNSSDSLQGFTNNIETDVNLGIAFGRSLESYLFRPGQSPELRSHHFSFFSVGLSRLKLNDKNTDNNVNVNNDHILNINLGLGFQFGYKNFGLSLMVGKDTPTSSLGKYWVFKDSLWAGLGIGYHISN